MSRERNQAKKDSEKAGGGGAKGLQERTQSKIGISCALCKTNFQSIKMKQQLKGIHYVINISNIIIVIIIFRSLGG